MTGPEPAARQVSQAAQAATASRGMSAGGAGAEGVPSLLRVALLPKWIGMLVACLAVAAVFAALGRWQLDSAIRSAERPVVDPATAIASPLAEHLEPQKPLYERSIGATVRFDGVLDPADLEVLDGRLQGEREGAWVIGRVHVTDASAGADPAAVVADPAQAPGLAVALAWAPDAATAQSALEAIRAGLPSGPARFEGTLEYGQAPTAPKAGQESGTLREMSPAYLVNRWSPPSPSAYSAYVTLSDGTPPLPAGLEPIQRQTAGSGGELNWLNIFYAIEWAIFAGFALYLWWRLVVDDRRRMVEAAAADRGAALEERIRLERLRAIRDARLAAGEGLPGSAGASGEASGPAEPAGPPSGGS
ncbi:hypothetical protein USB125703_00361 [Pseudoclavibacter triregionum]|nr:hypothetical protein USB125703_00361 [Pseudoclavibacter triregionum]